LSPERAEERMAAALAQREAVRETASVDFAVSPHAPYSTPLKLIDRCVSLACQSGAALAMHVAESPQERMLLTEGSGRFAEVLKAAGLWREGLFPWPGDEPIVDLIERLAAAPRVLLIHGNDLSDREIQAIRRHDHVSVVYCPRTHDFFGHRRHPVDRLLAAGVRVALGTDSRASNPDLSVWREVQFLLRHRCDLDPHRVLQMASKFGGVALLGESTDHGVIRSGATRLDDLVAIPSGGRTLDQLWRDCADQDLRCNPVGRLT
jgi:cytosine/adenosine deaminase-related metal-dependent hydrolase